MKLLISTNVTVILLSTHKHSVKIGKIWATHKMSQDSLSSGLSENTDITSIITQDIDKVCEIYHRESIQN